MKPKPKIVKDVGGWVVERPGYGFARPTVNGPFPTQAAALASLTVGTGSAAAQVERTTTPEGAVRTWYGVKPMWPMEIR